MLDVENMFALSSCLNSRAQATVDLLEEGITPFEDDAHLRRHLLELKTLFEEIADVVQQCVPDSSSLSKTARRVFWSTANRKALAKKSTELERIRRTIAEREMLVAKKQVNRIEKNVLAIVADNTHPKNRLAKRLMEGKVIAEELEQNDGELLGTGSFGVVVAGRYYGRPVAIKKALSTACSEEDRENFR